MIVSRIFNRPAARVRFVLIYGATFLCAAVVVWALSHREPPPPKIVTVRAAPVPAPVANDFSALTRMEADYAQLIDEGRYEELNGADARLGLYLDSLEKKGESGAVAYGRQVLALHRRTASQLTSINTVSADPAVAELKNALKEKDRRIAQLQSEHKPGNEALPANYRYQPAKGESVEALKQSNVNLQLGFRDVMNKLWDSYRAYNLLKKENEALRRQVAELKH